jgi:hypothetical protein
MPTIYIICNTEDDETYIGRTSQTLEKRFKAHKSLVQNEQINTPLHLKMYLLGCDKFYIMELETKEIIHPTEDEKKWMRAIQNSGNSLNSYCTPQEWNRYYHYRNINNWGKWMRYILNEYTQYELCTYEGNYILR